MYENQEKTGLRRLWEERPVFFAVILSGVASLVLLISSYFFYLPDFEDYKPFIFLLYIVIRWLLLSLPAYMLSIYLEDHYKSDRHLGRFLLTAGISAAGQLVLIFLNWTPFMVGFLSGNPEKLVSSLSLLLLLVLPVLSGISLLNRWKPLVVQIAAGLTAAVLLANGIFAIYAVDIPAAIMSAGYIVYCVACFLSIPRIITYRQPQPLPEGDASSPKETVIPIMKDED